MDWQQELLKRLDLLTEKLGVTATYLWAVLVRQAYSDAIADGVIVIICGVILAVAPKFWRMAWAKLEEEDLFCACAVIVIASIIAACVGIANIIEAGQFLTNPEFYALKQLLH